jgi:predicted transcriptional regulator
MKPAKACYSHIGGKLGELLLENFVDKGWITKQDGDKHYHITPAGETGLTKMGLDLSKIKDE